MQAEYVMKVQVIRSKRRQPRFDIHQVVPAGLEHGVHLVILEAADFTEVVADAVEQETGESLDVAPAADRGEALPGEGDHLGTVEQGRPREGGRPEESDLRARRGAAQPPYQSAAARAEP